MTDPNEEQLRCDKWNAANGPTACVRYWPGVRTGPALAGRAITDARVLGGHTAGLFVAGAGFIALSHVEAAP